jgi:hypothetical protein
VALGDEQFDRLRAQGAAMAGLAILEYLSAEANRVLAGD